MKTPSFDFERHYWEQDIPLVAGIDEVGMGAWAGPVCAAAVIFRPETPPQGGFPIIRDSKTLSPAQREKAAVWIKENALAWAVGEASVREIEELNILQAARLAMRRAVAQLSAQPAVLIIDGRPPSHEASAGLAERAFELPSKFIIKGDQQSVSIAAASIVAKVYRDELMVQFDRQYPGYGLAGHKGYGAAVHLAALKALGASPIHRKTYAPVAATLT